MKKETRNKLIDWAETQSKEKQEIYKKDFNILKNDYLDYLITGSTEY